MPRKTLIASTLACTLLFAATHALAANPAEDAQRAQLSQALVKKWSGHVQATYKMNGQAWATEMAPAFAEASMEELKAAAGASDFDDVSRLLLGQPVLKREAGVSNPNALGNAATDLVYVPVTPCRILDTRLAGGQIAANTVRGVDVTAVTDYAFQGGSASNCGGVGAAGSFAAAVINFTVVGPTAAGFITAFPTGTTQPNAATLNYAAGAVVGNAAIVTLDQGAAANEVNVYSFATTHLVADITGYFINPAPTRLECVEMATAPSTIGAGGVSSIQTAACPATYEVTSGGCTTSTFDGRIVSSRTFSNTQTHFCAFRNEGAGSMEVVVYSRCCRVPGR